MTETEQKLVDALTYEGFLAFAKQQDPDKRYDYVARSECAFAQYVNSIFPDYGVGVSYAGVEMYKPGQPMLRFEGRDEHPMIFKMDDAAQLEAYETTTFGNLVIELERRIAQQNLEKELNNVHS